MQTAKDIDHEGHSYSLVSSLNKRVEHVPAGKLVSYLCEAGETPSITEATCVFDGLSKRGARLEPHPDEVVCYGAPLGQTFLTHKSKAVECEKCGENKRTMYELGESTCSRDLLCFVQGVA